MHQPAQLVEILLHVLGVDDQLVDDAGQAAQREVEMYGGVWADAAFDG
jgi:hypothetical protein